MYRLYLFDFDYTLVNSEQGILGCFHRTIDAWHLPPVTDDTIRKTIGLPMEQAVEIITGIHDAADIDRFIDDYRKDADIHMTPGTHFFPDTLPTLRALRKADAKIGIISTKTRSRIEEKFVADGCTDVIDLIIVPQYEVWTGAAGNTDWTNDANWARADRTELLRDAADEADYVTNATNGTAQGFVPMSHTSVIVTPQADGPLLYATDYSSAKGNNFVHFIEHEGDHRTATRDIEYALLAAQQATSGVNLCERYATYQTKDVVLQPHAELLHSERLHYKKAWMEYALNPDRWYTLGSPLQQTYAGDWYAPKVNAQQATPYFDDITFNL